MLVLDGDGHFMGITLAELMANQGKQVTYVCDASDVAEYGVFTMESANNKRMLFEKGDQDLLQSLGRAHRARQRAPHLPVQIRSGSHWTERGQRCPARTTAENSI